MSQHDLEIENASGSAVRADLNLALKALGSMMTGVVGSMPDTQVNMLISDTTSGHILKRNNSDTDWDYLMPIDQRIITSAIGTDSYAITFSPTIATGGYKDGVVYQFRADVANTGTATLAINGLTAKTIKKYYNGTLSTLSDGDISANQICRCQYDSTNNAMVLLNPNIPITSCIKQIVYHITSTAMSGTTPFPNCATSSIPQKTEGDQYLAVSITPTNANNYLKIDVCLQCFPDIGGYTYCGAAVFQDSTANALFAVPFEFGVYVSYSPINFSYIMLANTTSTTEFKVRAGVYNGVALYVNRAYAGGYYTMGGKINSSITITEFEA